MDEWDAIPISLISHAGYCLRRAALLTNERLWSESADTAKGRSEHVRVHTQRIEHRGDSAKLYEFPVYSHTLGIGGKCDCIEAISDPKGAFIPDLNFPAKLYPVEYKHGKLRSELEYELQLCAQAMCLEEMFDTHIPQGDIFYITSHRRYPVSLTEELRELVKETIRKIESLRRTFYIPPAEYGAKCRACSLKELCQPNVRQSAATYCNELHNEAMRNEAL